MERCRAAWVHVQAGGKARDFVLHAFLSHIELKSHEIIFHYTHGIVRVIGRNLDGIHSGIRNQSITGFRRSEPDDPRRTEIEVNADCL